MVTYLLNSLSQASWHEGTDAKTRDYVMFLYMLKYVHDTRVVRLALEDKGRLQLFTYTEGKLGQYPSFEHVVRWVQVSDTSLS